MHDDGLAGAMDWLPFVHHPLWNCVRPLSGVAVGDHNHPWPSSAAAMNLDSRKAPTYFVQPHTASARLFCADT